MRLGKSCRKASVWLVLRVTWRHRDCFGICLVGLRVLPLLGEVEMITEVGIAGKVVRRAVGAETTNVGKAVGEKEELSKNLQEDCETSCVEGRGNNWREDWGLEGLGRG